jgi:hypothetical protein
VGTQKSQVPRSPQCWQNPETTVQQVQIQSSLRAYKKMIGYILIVFGIFFGCAAAQNITIPFNYPLFKQVLKNMFKLIFVFVLFCFLQLSNFPI